VFLGVGEVIGGILEGVIIDKFGNKPAIIINILVLITAVLAAV
jgi:MFS family permease